MQPFLVRLFALVLVASALLSANGHLQLDLKHDGLQVRSGPLGARSFNDGTIVGLVKDDKNIATNKPSGADTPEEKLLARYTLCECCERVGSGRESAFEHTSCSSDSSLTQSACMSTFQAAAKTTQDVVMIADLPERRSAPLLLHQETTEGYTGRWVTLSGSLRAPSAIQCGQLRSHAIFA